MLIFVHGMLSNANVWNPIINYFNDRNFSCKAVNLKEGLNLRKVHFQDYVKKVKTIVKEEDIVIDIQGMVTDSADNSPIIEFGEISLLEKYSASQTHHGGKFLTSVYVETGQYTIHFEGKADCDLLLLHAVFFGYNHYYNYDVRCISGIQTINIELFSCDFFGSSLHERWIWFIGRMVEIAVIILVIFFVALACYFLSRYKRGPHREK